MKHTKRPGARKTYRTIASSDGFTLPEILVAVLITGMIFTFIFGALTSSLAASKDVELRMEINHVGRFLINRIARDVSHATLLDNNENGRFVGTHHTTHDGKSMDEVHFTAFTRSYVGSLGFDRQIDQAEIGYYFRTDEDENRDRYQTLVRRESEIIDSQVEDGGYGLDVTDMVEELSIRYMSGSTWLDDWDSSTNGALPDAVSVELTLSDGGREYFFSTIAKVML